MSTYFGVLVLLLACVVLLLPSCDANRQLIVSDTCEKQLVVNATCLPSLTNSGAEPRWDEVMCSQDRQRIGQVSYADANCSVVVDSIVVPNDICMVCPNATLNQYLPELAPAGSIISYENPATCTGNTHTRNFYNNSCSYDSASDDIQQQFALECSPDGGIGTLRVFNRTDGLCEGVPFITRVQASGVCVQGVKFVCPNAVGNGAASLGMPALLALFLLCVAEIGRFL